MLFKLNVIFNTMAIWWTICPQIFFFGRKKKNVKGESQKGWDSTPSAYGEESELITLLTGFCGFAYRIYYHINLIKLHELKIWPKKKKNSCYTFVTYSILRSQHVSWSSFANSFSWVYGNLGYKRPRNKSLSLEMTNAWPNCIIKTIDTLSMRWSPPLGLRQVG